MEGVVVAKNVDLFELLVQERFVVNVVVIVLASFRPVTHGVVHAVEPLLNELIWGRGDDHDVEMDWQAAAHLHTGRAKPQGRVDSNAVICEINYKRFFFGIFLFLLW